MVLSFNNVLQNVSTVCRLFYFYTTKQYNVTFKNSSLALCWLSPKIYISFVLYKVYVLEL